MSRTYVICLLGFFRDNPAEGQFTSIAEKSIFDTWVDQLVGNQWDASLRRRGLVSDVPLPEEEVRERAGNCVGMGVAGGRNGGKEGKPVAGCGTDAVVGQEREGELVRLVRSWVAREKLSQLGVAVMFSILFGSVGLT